MVIIYLSEAFIDVKDSSLKIHTYKALCDWICKKGSYTRNYKYLEVQL